MAALREVLATRQADAIPSRRFISTPPTPVEPSAIATRKGSFVVVGGLRASLGIEAWKKSTPRHRRAILREVSRERPDFVALLGDLVFCGSSADAWADFDRLSSPLKANGIPAYPALGNHDYWLSRRAALSNYFGRFPHLGGRRWYAATYAGLGLIFLDSNVQWLTAGSWKEQIQWYEGLLARWDAEPSILGAIVFLYHPAFTKRESSDIRHVQRDVLPGFLASRKTRAMVSGLVHDDAPFFRSGKAFLAAGAAGPTFGASGARARQATSDPTLRYLRIRPEGGGVAVEIRGLEPGAAGFEDVGRYDLPWAAGER